ncbi:hypothetical protein FRC17_008056, partial [Serendipita sp. 399]
MILGSLKRSGTEEKRAQRRDLCLYLISTRRLPWESTVPFYGGKWYEQNVPSSSLVRRLRVIDWVDNLENHPQKAIILLHLSDFGEGSSLKILLTQNSLKDEEESELKRVGLGGFWRWTRAEERLYSALSAFDRLIGDAESQEVKTNLIEWITRMIRGDLMDSDVSLDPKYLGNVRKEGLQGLSNPFLRLIACVALGIEWKEEWTPDLLKARQSLNDAWTYVSYVCFRHSPFFNGDQTFLWQLRLRLWLHFHPYTSWGYLNDTIRDITLLKRVVQEIQSSRLGIDHAADFLLALLHLNLAYTWDGGGQSLFASIPSILTHDDTIPEYNIELPTECVEYLSSICDEISTNPARLIRLLIELVRADINCDPPDRLPRNLLNLLRHAESRLSGKELRPFLPACQRLICLITESYEQFKNAWDSGIYHRGDLWLQYAHVDIGELETVCQRVIALLDPPATWEGESKDISWPRKLLRPTGTRLKRFKKDVERASSRNQNEENDEEADEEEEDEET